MREKENNAGFIFSFIRGIFLAFLPLAFLSLSPMAVSAGTVYHVAIGGSDEAPGSEVEPFASVQRGLEAAGAGDTVQVGPGVFFGQSRFVNSGEEGTPVVLRGTLGEDGERLTRLEAGEAVDPETWEPAPEVGPGAWRNRGFGYEPQLLMVDGKFLGHVHRSRNLAMEYLAAPEDRVVESRGVEIPFWETLGGIYAYHPDPDRKITYLRLAGGADPREHSITISPGGGVISVEGVSHVEIRDLEIAAGDEGVRIAGRGTGHVLVEKCFITHGRKRINIVNHASGVTVRDCRITMGFYGHQTGAWGAGGTQDLSRKAYIYRFFKYRHGRASASDDRGIHAWRGASDLLIEDNVIDTGLIAVNLNNVSNVRVRGNSITRVSSVGTTVSQDTVNVHVEGNFYHDCNINLRVASLGSGAGRRAFIYGNRFSQPGRAGSHIAATGSSDKAIVSEEVAIYHNSFHEGAAAFSWPLEGSMPHGIPSFRILNNVFSSAVPSRWSRREDNPDAVLIFDHNWLGGSNAGLSEMAWLGENNIFAGGEKAWEGEERDFRLPEGHAARGSGIDLSRPFTIDGVEYEPLPGMEPGYFSGERPDMGAVQH